MQKNSNATLETYLTRCPSLLRGAAAREEWKELAPVFWSRGLLTQLFRRAFEAYCLAWGDYLEVEQEITKLGVTGDKQELSQLSARSRQSFNLARKYLAEFGMTPAQRARIISQEINSSS